MVSALSHNIAAIDERGSVVPQVLKGLPRQDRAPSACPWLHRIIGVLRRCGRAERGRHHITLTVVPRRNQQAQSDLRIVGAGIFTFWAAHPILRSETDITDSGRMQGRVLSLLAPAGVNKRKSPRKADPGGELVTNRESIDVGFGLNLGTQLCPGEILRRTAEMHMGIDVPYTDRGSPVTRLQVAAAFRTI